MEQNEILEGNKLIAKFMGGKYQKANKKQDIEERYFNLINNGYYHTVSQLRYHISWDWIMPVVKKIETFRFHQFSVTITDDLCEITKFVNTDKNLKKCKQLKIISILSDNKINAVYLAVVEFIKWYNKNANDGK